MSLTRRFLISLPGAVVFAAAAMAQTAPTQIFQLNGNAANSNLATCTYGSCDYWDLLNGTGNNISGGGIGAGSSAGASSIRTFINGSSTTNAFTTGGSKDSNLISQWAYSSTSTPNKDTINAGYAAAYTGSTSGNFFLIFGADRASPNGDANIGIWFFQNQVGPNGSGGFTGSHMDHDIFVISAFTGGGGSSTVTVYEWDHTCSAGVKNPTAGQCADTNLKLLAAPATSCGSSIYCGITNTALTNTTWEGSLASPLFFEGGVNLTAAFAAVGVTQLPCFSSFLEETRSSQSTTAVLKDFVAGGFPVCGLSITKSCGTPTLNSGGTAVNYPVNGLVKNTGVGTLYNVSVFDTPQGGTTGPAILVVNNSGSSNNGSSTLGAGETGTWSDSTTSTAASASDSAFAQGGLSSSTIPNGNTAQTNTVSSSAAPATCTSNFSTSLAVTKSCTTSLQVQNSLVSVLVGFSGKVYNNGPSQVTGVVLTDTPSSGATGTINVGTLGPCNPAVFDANGNCTTAGASASYSSNYVPTNIDTVISGVGGPGTGPGRYSWTDAVTITSATATVGTLPKLTTGPFSGTYGGASASCPICQGSGECTP